MLGGAEVLDVRVRNGVITHVLDRPLEETIQTIMKSVDRFSEVHEEQEDDQTMVLIKHI